MSQIFNAEGLLHNYEDLKKSRYNIPVTPREFAIVFDAILSGTLMLFRGVTRSHLDLPSLNPVDSPIGTMCFSLLSQNNRSIRALFQSDIVSIPYFTTYWNTFVNNSC